MTTYTRAQLATRALQKLLVVGAGQSPDSEDQARASDTVPAVIEDLAARRIYVVADMDEIEASAYEYIADCLAQAIASDFGRPRDVNVITYAESRLRVINSTDPTYEVLKADYF